MHKDEKSVILVKTLPREKDGKGMEVKKDGWLKMIWRLFYPLLLYMGIQILLELMVSFVLTLKVLMDAGGLSMQHVVAKVLDLYLGLSYYVTVFGALAAIPFLYLFYRRDRKKRLEAGTEIIYCHATAMEYILIGLVAFGACIGGNNLILGSGLMEMDSSYQQVSEILYSAPFLVQLIGTGILVPLCEELIFRGLMYKRLKEYVPAGTAMVTTALVFGLYHGNIVQMVYAMTLGYLMAYIYEKYHSFLAPILFHAVSNLLSVLITETGIFGFMYTNKMMMLLSGCIGVGIVLAGMRIIRNDVKLEPKDPESKVEL